MVELAVRLLNSCDQVKRLSVLSGGGRKVLASDSTTPRRCRRLSEADVDALVAAYQAGRTIRELADVHELDRSTVQRHLRLRGVNTRYRKLTPEGVDACVQRYAAGESTVDIAAGLGVHKDTVRRHLIARRVEMRSGRFGG